MSYFKNHSLTDYIVILYAASSNGGSAHAQEVCAQVWVHHKLNCMSYT